MSDKNFPLTLAEVLYAELCGDPTTQPSALDGVQLKKQIKEFREEVRKDKNKTIEFVGDTWFDADEGRDWNKRKQASDEVIRGIYQIIHFEDQPEPKPRQTPRSALCLSGGGVRSATFNLGVLQGLARCGLLEKFDYLSTVSGGGFIGSWLTAWIYRKEIDFKEGKFDDGKPPKPGLKAVIDSLSHSPRDPLKPEPGPLYNLRVYANYLTPRKGLMSADTWTLVAIYLRNLMLNWCVFIPVIMAVLLLPRIWLALLRTSNLSADSCLTIGFIAGVISLSYISVGLPSSRAQFFNRDDTWFVACCLVPLVVMAMALTAYWKRLGSEAAPSLRGFIKFGALMAIVPIVFIVVAHVLATRIERRKALAEGKHLELARKLWNNVIALLLIGLAFVVTSFLMSSILQSKVFSPEAAGANARLYASLAVPAMLLMLSGGGTLIAGFTSYYTEVDDQEWWARTGACILIVAIGWSISHLLVLFGPRIFVEAQALLLQRSWSWASLKGVVTTVVGIGSGAISLFGGYSSETPAHGSEESGEQPRQSFLAPLVLPISSAVFAAFIVLCLAQITNWLVALAPVAIPRLLPTLLADWFLPQATPLALHSSKPAELIYHTPTRLLVLMGTVLAVFGTIMGRLINTNKFSLHYYWRNRMMRAYLGASRNEDAREASRNKFTDFDQSDNVRMYKLAEQRPMHMVNVTLNLTGGKKLEWQDRKAESFTMSPLHCGSYWLGYRNAKEYALNSDNEGISLATAVAISGAAASPNMGYMMTSPIVRFIMTLFNIRMGFWLGNPGPGGSATFQLDSPRESVRPIVEEALGMTNDKKPYVYLSDGGHFENFGLYEMILRRCRFIVVSDASTDTNYAYESLAMAIRQIRVDFGVPIDMGEMKFSNHPDAGNNYCAVGLIKYACVDRPGGSSDDAREDAKYDGVLVYIKPSLLGDEPRDVLNYHATSPTFPEETIADQWFSESQFESYRALGSHMIETICDADEKPGDDQPERVVIGSVRISSEANTNREELSVLGWIENLGSKPGTERGTPGVEKRISEVIRVLTPAGGGAPRCKDFAGFAEKATQHVGRRQHSGAEN